MKSQNIKSTLATIIFRKTVCILAYIIWVPIGIIVWVPTLVLEVALFCGALMTSMLSNNDHLFANRKQKMDKVIVLYASGFENIKSIDTGIPGIEKVNPKDHYIDTFVGRIIWCLIFWSGLILLFSL